MKHDHEPRGQHRPGLGTTPALASPSRREAARGEGGLAVEAERASREAEITFELRTRDRYRKLLSKIAQALKRIETESYGFCDETGEPIGLERLEARPIATLSVEAQERREQLERQYGDR